MKMKPPKEARGRGSLEQFPESAKRFSGENCDKNKELEQTSGSIESHSALTGPERLLWQKVAATVRPLIPDRWEPPLQTGIAAFLREKNAREGETSTRSVPPSPLLPMPATSSVTPAPQHSTNNGALPLIDHKTHDKIARGRLKIEARLDLHGLNREEAHAWLLDFITSAAGRGQRHVLIITGKGSADNNREGRGVLRQLVPQWLATAPFRLHVSAVQDAARHHGGAGALYVKLRRPMREIS